jgi:predicted AAA+ superfamily ATPase
LDHGRSIWERISALSHAREQLSRDAFLSAPISCLVGEKGVGKTVLACQKALQRADGDLKKLFYVSLDDTFFAGDTMYELAALAQEHGVRVVVFDEVHRYASWKTELKQIADRLSISCIVSGSSILSFRDLGGLARRMVKYELKGMLFREFLNFTHELHFSPATLDSILGDDRERFRAIRSEIEDRTGRTLPLLFDEYLRRGYYAYGVSPLRDNDFLALLRQATEDTIAYEIVLAQTHSRPDMARKLQAIFKAIAQNVPYTIDYEALKAYAHVSDTRTLKHYLACLQDAGIIRAIDRLTLKSLRKPERLYLANSCLYHAYADLAPDIGSIRETFFLTSLALAGHDALVHDRKADFTVGPHSFEIGGPKKGMRQIAGETNAYIVKDEFDLSADRRVLPLWVFGFL